MKTVVLNAASLLLCGALALPASAAGDAAAGQKLAQQYCARCHDIQPGGAFKKYPPSFASIAVFRSGEQIYARIVFPSLHAAGSPMPEFSQVLLDASSIDNIVAYIVSLEKK